MQLEQAQRNLARQRDLWGQQLTTRESLDKVENDLERIYRIINSSNAEG